MPADRFGLPLSAASSAATAAYVDATDRLLAFWPGAQQALERALAADEGFALAHAAMARWHLTWGRGAEARDAIGRARTLAAGSTPRARSHVEAIGRVVDGDAAGALALVREHVAEHPRDAFVLSLALGAFGLLAFSGRADHDAQRLALVRDLAPHYGNDWWFLTQLGWSLTEAGELEAGRQAAERGMALRAENAHGAHALAHSFHERGACRDGIAWLTDWLRCYPSEGTLHGHLNWHLALLELAEGRADRALALYESTFRPSVSQAPPLNVVTDGPGLLWRLLLDGRDGRDVRDDRDAEGGLDGLGVGHHRNILEAAWRECADYAARTYPQAGAHFADLHCAIAAAATGDRDGLRRRVEQLGERLASGRLAPGEVAIAACRGIEAFARADYAGAIAQLEPVCGQFVRLGGSHAQRELLEDTLIVACQRVGQAARSLPLLEQRLAARPSARDSAWRAAALGPQAPALVRGSDREERWFHEGCFVTEWLNGPEDETLSVARARVEPGTTTRWHRLRGTTERYVVTAGRGRVEVDGMAPAEAGPGDVVVIPAGAAQRIANTGDDLLVFLAICTPRFRPQAYEDVDAGAVPGASAAGPAATAPSA
jgi:mannose-6-phosphate isomerase-like protein (cupin superfamily)